MDLTLDNSFTPASNLHVLSPTTLKLFTPTTVNGDQASGNGASKTPQVTKGKGGQPQKDSPAAPYRGVHSSILNTSIISFEQAE